MKRTDLLLFYIRNGCKRLKLFLIFPLLILSAEHSFAQEKIQVTGVVVDAQSGSPLPGVSILLKGTQAGTITDVDGKYLIEVTPEDVLVFSFIGFLKQEIAVKNNNVINVTLSTDIIGLNEIVITGYGVQKKSDLTGAVVSVSGETLNEIPSIGIDQALQGHAAGVSISSLSGIPGGVVKIQIRGISSVNGADPLVIIDGVEGDISQLNIGDVESVEILKDAASAAIYGVSGGNGVILISTKKGKEGKLRTSFNYYRGYQRPWKKMNMMNSQEYAKIANIMAAQENKELFTTQPDTLAEYDWQDIMFKTSIMDNYDLSFSGGSEKSTFFVSVNYQRQNGILEKTDFNQLNFRINSEHKMTKFLSFGENINFNKKHSEGFQEWEFRNEYNTPLVDILHAYPFCGDYDENGDWIIHYEQAVNPRVKTDIMDRQRDFYYFGGNLFANLHPLKGLEITSKINGFTNFNFADNFVKVYEYIPTIKNDESSYEKRFEQNYGWEFQNYFNYYFSLRQNHSFGITGGIESKYFYEADIYGKRLHLINNSDEMQYFDASLNDEKKELTGGGSESASWGLFGRLNYDYKGKYLVSANIRRDVSSRFAPEYRVGIFSSVSLGWKFSEESFMQNQSLISFGKLRLSRGSTGANAPTTYAYYNTVSTDNAFYYYIFDGTDNTEVGGSPTRLSNSEMHWETILMSSVGIDLAFLSNRLSVTMELFRKTNDGMLIYKNVPYYAGINQSEYSGQFAYDARPLVNIGNVNNEGFEFSGNYRFNIGAVKGDVGGNFSIIRNEVTSFDEDTVLEGSLGVNLYGLNMTTAGQPMAQFYGYRTDGLFTWDDAAYDAEGNVYIWNQPYTINTRGDTIYAQPKAQPGDFRFQDTNGDNMVNNDDKVVLGNPIPKFIFGFNFDLEYKGFDVSLFFEGKFGHQIFNGNKSYYMYQNNAGNKLDIALDQYYDDVYDSEGNLLYEGNTDTDLPRLTRIDKNYNFTRVSDFYIEDGAYVRLKNLQIGYTFPAKILDPVNIEKFRIYVGARNLLTFTKYTGFDPEVGSDNYYQIGIDKGGYPQNRMYLGGINIVF